MALDEGISRAVSQGLAPPTVRFYAWQPPCLSLGRAQPADQVNWAACRRDGVDVVRRPTGGRAILHTDELTYAVIAPESDPRLAGGLLESYRRLSQGLLAGLGRLGLPATHSDPLPSGQSRPAAPVCFEVPSSYEIVAATGRKLIGSAQMRTRGVVLQHGSLPLVGDIARICRYLSPAPDPGGVRARAVTLETALGRPVAWRQAADALAAGLSQRLNLIFERGGLTPDEVSLVEHLRTTRYATQAWTGKV